MFSNTSSHPSINKLIDVCLKMVCAFAIWLSAQSSLVAQGFFDDGVEAFLPVEKAYVVSPRIDSDDKQPQAVFSWLAAKGYYLYRHQFSLTLKTANETQTLALSIPKGKLKYDEAFDEELEVYYGTVDIRASLPNLKEPYELQLMSQGCADAGLCYPPRVQYFSVIDGVITETPASTLITAAADAQSLDLNDETSRPDGALTKAIPVTTPIATPNASSLFVIILSAILGGMILNLMPCVFPVLSLKALSFASSSHDHASHKANGWAYTLGVVLSFIATAIVIVLAKSAGSALGWGFQLQQPIFVAALIYLFFLLSLNLFGFFEIGAGLMGVGQSLTDGNGKTASFFTGVLAALVASPCTAPFMATAIGYTLTQGSAVTIIIFASLGFGMALPLLLLSYVPNIASKLPAPGPWMETFKQLLAFPLLFTCVWLMNSYGKQTSVYDTVLIVGGMVCIALALWLFKHTPVSPLKWLVRGLAALALVAAAKVALDSKVTESTGPSSDQWEAFSVESLNTLRESGTPVFVDFTADWCITCKVNEKVALNTDEVRRYASENGVVMMQGDWTKPDPEITQILNQFGRNGVPLYLMYSGDPEIPAEVLPQILSQRSVIDAMTRAVKGK